MITPSVRISRAACTAWALTVALPRPSYAQESVSPPTNEPTPEKSTPAQGSERTPPNDAGEQTESRDEGTPQDAAPSGASPNVSPPTPAPEVDPYAEAKQRVKRARKLYDSKNYDAALTEFQRAYDTMLGHPARPNVLYNIGRCQEGLYRYGDAIASYEKYLQEAGEDAPDRIKVQTTIESLEGFLGTIRVDVTAKKGALPNNYQVWVDARLVGEGVESFLVPGGNHTVEIRAEGFESVSREVQLPSRSERTVTVRLTPLAQEYKGLPPTYFYTAGGIALAAGAAGGAFGIMAMSKRSSLDSMRSEAVTKSDVDDLESTALIADIFFIGAGVFVTSATILAFMTDWSEPTSDEGLVQLKQIGLLPLSSGAAVSLGGSF